MKKTQCTDEIVCPLCFYEFKSSSDYLQDLSGMNETEVICENESCGKEFKITVDYSVHYYTDRVIVTPED